MAKSPKGKLLLPTSPEKFFLNAIHRVIKNCRASVKESTIEYLVNILLLYLFVDNLFQKDKDSKNSKTEETFAESYLSANNETRLALRFEKLKQLADKSLYITGVFNESLKKRMINTSYCVSIGRSAYSSLAKITKKEEDQKIFMDLCVQFYTFIEVFRLMSKELKLQSTKDNWEILNQLNERPKNISILDQTNVFGEDVKKRKIKQ